MYLKYIIIFKSIWILFYKTKLVLHYRDENRREIGEHAVDAQNGRYTGGRAGRRMQDAWIRFGRLLGVRGHRVHGHHISSGGHVQNGTVVRPAGCRRPDVERTRRGRSQGGGRVHHADHRPGEHERADNHDRGKGVRHDQAQMAGSPGRRFCPRLDHG